jgi:hypothetical protein
MMLSTAGTLQIQKRLVINQSAVGDVGLIIKQVASQTGDMLQWQNSAGTVLAKLTAAGALDAVTLTQAGTAVSLAGHTHEGSGAPVTNVAPTASAPGDASAVGTGTSSAREDHKHARETLAAGVFDATATAVQSIANNAWTTVTFNSEQTDTLGGHDNATNPSRYTATVAGWYQLHATVSFAVNATGNRGLKFLTNATTSWGRTLTPSVSTNSPTVSSSTLVFLNIGDYAEVQIFQTSGGALDTILTDGGPRFQAAQASGWALATSPSTFSDTFNRADSTTVGNGWAVYLPTGTSASTWQVASNRVNVQARTGTNNTYLLRDMGRINGQMTATVRSPNTADWIGFVLHWQDANNYSMARYAAGTWEIRDVVANSSSQRGTTTASSTIADGDVIKVAWAGSTINLYRNATLVASANNSSFVGGTLHGLMGYTVGAVNYDDFTFSSMEAA